MPLLDTPSRPVRGSPGDKGSENSTTRGAMKFLPKKLRQGSVGDLLHPEGLSRDGRSSYHSLFLANLSGQRTRSDSDYQHWGSVQLGPTSAACESRCVASVGPNHHHLEHSNGPKTGGPVTLGLLNWPVVVLDKDHEFPQRRWSRQEAKLSSLH